MPAPTIEELTVTDEPQAWEALGFAVEGESCRLGEVRVRFLGRGSGSRRGIVGWSLRELQSTELDGLLTSVAQGAVAQSAPEHPNGVSAIDHIVAMTPDFERSVTA